MRLRNFRIGLRLLVEAPAYSLVSIVGLGIGIGVFSLLVGYARYCWQYNAYLPDADHVYLVKQRNNLELGTPWTDQSAIGLVASAQAIPGVTSSTGFVGWLPLTVQIEGRLRKLNSLTVLPGFAEMMGLEAVQGNLTEALSRPDCFALTEAAARRLFGRTDVLGRSVLLRLSAVDENQSIARIAAIVRDPPANSTIRFDTLNGPNLALVPPLLHEQLLSGRSFWPGYVLLRIAHGGSLTEVTDRLQQAVDRGPLAQEAPPEMKERLGDRKVVDIELSRLRDAYFDQAVVTTFTSAPTERGDPGVVASLVAVAILVLALAAVNYVNLATIRVLRRQREIAIRKVLGAGRGRLALQFVAESLSISVLATMLGLLLAGLALPTFSTLMNRDLGSVLSPGHVAAVMGLGVALGLLTAAQPAWTALRVRPSLMLAGRPDAESTGSRRLRRALSVLQVAAAMGLAGFTLAIAWQSRYVMNASPGFDPSSLLVFELPVSVSARDPKARGLVATLSAQPGIAGIAVSNDPIGRPRELWSTRIERDGRAAVTMDVKTVSPNFFDVYGIRPTGGRLFDPALDPEGDAVPIVLNAIAARELGFASPEAAIGEVLQFRSVQDETVRMITKRIIGIAPEIRFYSLREPPGALAYQLRLPGDSSGWDGTLTVRAGGPVADVERAVRTAWPQYFPNSVLEMSPAKAIYAANYAQDARLARLLAIATLVALLIAAFGVYVLAADAVQRRTKEIALRKLFGTRRRDVALLVAKEIGWVLIASAMLALPAAGLAIGHYLAGYTEHAPYVFCSLAVAALAALVTASAAAIRQAWVAMTLKPAVALRT